MVSLWKIKYLKHNYLADIGGYGVDNIILWLYNNYDDICVPIYRFHWLLCLLLVCQKDLWCRQGGLESLLLLTAIF